jgi:hypothetical protein
MERSIRPWVVVLALIVATVTTLFLFSANPPRPGNFFFEITLSSENPGIAQLFYDAGHGFREQDSVRRPVNANMGQVVYRFALSPGTYRALRFDPIDRPGTATFSDAKIVGPRGQAVQFFAPGQFIPAHDIASLTPTNGRLEMRTVPDGNDPYLILALEKPLTLLPEVDHGRGFWRVALASLPAFMFVFLAVMTVCSVPPPRPTINLGWPIYAAVALILFKLWLVSAQTIFAIGGSTFDDQLFLTLASELLSGHWLGSYSQFTLMKGPLFSFFAAAAFLLGIPLFIAQHLLYAGACGLMTRALRPLIRWPGLRLALFAVLLFNPATYSGAYAMRVMRQNLLPALSFLIIAGLVALYARRDGPKRRLLPWALLTGIALPAFWLTREESVWILPCVGLLWTAAAVAVWRGHTSDRRQRLAILALPALLWAAGVGAVAGVNYWNYGIFTTCEFNRAEFKDAFGALLRVEPKQQRVFIPITREMRERLYAVSPAFAELSPYLEGQMGHDWATSAEWLTHLSPDEREIAVGWFMWALRDAVVAAGHAQTADEAMAFYARLAREINEACDRGVIKAGPHRSGFLPPLRSEYLSPFFGAYHRAAALVVSFDRMSPTCVPSQGSPDDLAFFADLTRGRLSPPAGGVRLPPKQRWLDHIRLNVLDRTYRIYPLLVPWAGGTAVIALITAGVIALVRRRPTYFAVVSVAAIGSIMAIVAIDALIAVTSYPTSIDVIYLAGTYGLWLLFIFSSWLALFEVTTNRTRPI